MTAKLKVYRFDPAKDQQPYYQTFEVEAEPMDRLLDCLIRIRAEQDSTLSFRMSCAHGICGSDGMRINGLCGLACQKLVKDFEGEILVEPLPVFKVIKDLVVDQDLFFEKYYSIKPFLMTQRFFTGKGTKTVSGRAPSVRRRPPMYPLCLLYSLLPCQSEQGDRGLCRSCRAGPCL